MSTAIVYAHTPDGFVVAADGRARDAESKQIRSDIIQKIFHTKVGRFSLVYAWSGETTFFRKDGTVLLDLNVATATILQSLISTDINSFCELIQSFSKQFTVLFDDAPASMFSKKEVAKVLFVGYFYDEPCRASIVFNRGAVTGMVPKITKLDAPMRIKFKVFTGSQEACRFSTLGQSLPLSGQDAASRMREYIRLCFIHRDPPLDCENPIGGHIHIGQLNPSGFSWIDRPIEHKEC